MSEHDGSSDRFSGSSDPAQDSADRQKPEVTNPRNLAPVDPGEPRNQREDIRAAIFETRLRRWALIGCLVAVVGYFVWQNFF